MESRYLTSAILPKRLSCSASRGPALVFAPFLSLRSAVNLDHLENDTLTCMYKRMYKYAMRKRWSAIIRSHERISEGEKIDPRGLGTQLYSAASPNQVFYNTKVDGEDNGPQRDGALRQPGRSSERVVSVR